MQPLHDAIPEERDPRNESLLDLLGRASGGPEDKPPLEEVQEQAVARVLTRLQAALQEERSAPLQSNLLPIPLHNERRRERTMNSTGGTFGTPAVPERRPFPRLLHVAEGALAVALVASLIVAWLAVTRMPHSQSTQPDHGPPFTYSGQQDEYMTDLHWTPDDRYLTFALVKGLQSDVGMRQYRVLVWDRETRKLRQPLLVAQHVDEKHRLFVATSPDGRYAFIITVNDGETTLKIENLMSGQIDLVTTDKVLTWPQFSPDSIRLAYVGSANRIFVWDLLARKLLVGDAIDSGYTMPQLSWLPDGKSLVLELSTAQRTSMLQIWNPVTGHNVQSIASTPSMTTLSEATLTGGISPDGQRLLTYNNTAGMVQVRDTPTLRVISTFQFHAGPPGSVVRAELVAGGQRLLLLAPDGKSWQVWNAETGQIVMHMPIKQLDDNPQIVMIVNKLLVLQYQGKPIEVWDMLTGKRVSIIQPPFSQFYTFGTNNRYRVIGFEEAMDLYDLLSGKRVATYRGITALLTDDARYIAVESVTPVAKQSDMAIHTIKVMKFG